MSNKKTIDPGGMTHMDPRKTEDEKAPMLLPPNYIFILPEYRPSNMTMVKDTEPPRRQYHHDS